MEVSYLQEAVSEEPVPSDGNSNEIRTSNVNSKMCIAFKLIQVHFCFVMWILVPEVCCLALRTAKLSTEKDSILKDHIGLLLQLPLMQPDMNTWIETLQELPQKEMVTEGPNAISTLPPSLCDLSGCPRNGRGDPYWSALRKFHRFRLRQ